MGHLRSRSDIITCHAILHAYALDRPGQVSIIKVIVRVGNHCLLVWGSWFLTGYRCLSGIKFPVLR